MEQLAKSFITDLEQRQHVQCLLKNRSLKVHFHSDTEHLYLLIEDGRVSITEQMECEIKIQGSYTALSQLFKQRKKLRQMTEDQCPIQIKGSFRSTLFLETILYLGKY